MLLHQVTTSIQIVAQMDELFAIDAQARQEGLSQIDRHVLRLEKSKPLLEQIKAAIQAARTDANLFFRRMLLTVAEGMSRCPASVRALQRESPFAGARQTVSTTF
jgi:hypothetical protein